MASGSHVRLWRCTEIYLYWFYFLWKGGKVGHLILETCYQVQNFKWWIKQWARLKHLIMSPLQCKRCWHICPTLPPMHSECITYFAATKENDNVANLFFLQPIVASMKISSVTVILWRKQLDVDMNYSRKSARPLASVRTKFTEILNVQCARLVEKGCII